MSVSVTRGWSLDETEVSVGSRCPRAGAVLSTEVLPPPGSEHLALLCLLCC